jgi:hypothetical protein
VRDPRGRCADRRARTTEEVGRREDLTGPCERSVVLPGRQDAPVGKEQCRGVVHPAGPLRCHHIPRLRHRVVQLGNLDGTRVLELLAAADGQHRTVGKHDGVQELSPVREAPGVPPPRSRLCSVEDLGCGGDPGRRPAADGEDLPGAGQQCNGATGPLAVAHRGHGRPAAGGGVEGHGGPGGPALDHSTVRHEVHLRIEPDGTRRGRRQSPHRAGRRVVRVHGVRRDSHLGLSAEDEGPSVGQPDVGRVPPLLTQGRPGRPGARRWVVGVRLRHAGAILFPA